MTSGSLRTFLGVPADASPEALLGVGPEATAAEILNARDRRIAALDNHPQSETPEADEARLALHASAAVLLAKASRAASAVGQPRAKGVQPAAESFAALEADVIRSIGASGGWGPEALRRVLHHAHTLGLTADDVVPAIRSAMKPSHARRSDPRADDTPVAGIVGATQQQAPQTRQPASPAAQTTTDQRSGPSASVGTWIARVVAVVAGLAAVGVLFSAVGLARRLAPAAEPTKKPDTAEIDPLTEMRQSLADDGVSTQPTETFIPERRTTLDRAVFVERELLAATAGFDLDPSTSSDRAADAILAFVSGWTASGPDERDKVVSAMRSYARASARRPDLQRDVFEAVVSRADAQADLLDDGGREFIGASVLTALWPADKLPSDLTAEQTRVVQRVGLARSARRGLGFTSLAGTASQGVAERIDPRSAQRVQEFAGMVRDAQLPEEAAQPALLTVVERWLLESPGAVTVSEREGLRSIVRALAWRANAPARRRVVAWLGDPLVPTDRAVELANTVVTHSSAPGITPLLQMPDDPTPEQRAEVAERFAAAWGVPTLRQDDLFASGWRDARSKLDALPSPGGPGEALSRAVEYLRLNTAASLSSQGRAEDAIDELEGVRVGDRDATLAVLPERIDVRAGSDDGQYLLELAEAGSSGEATIEVLDRAATDARPLGPTDARAISELAIGASSSSIRSAAGEALVRHAGEVAVLIELASAVVDGPATSSARRLVERVAGVPMPEDADWVTLAHAALLEAALLAQAPEAESDGYAVEFARLYSVQLSDDPGIGGEVWRAIDALAASLGGSPRAGAGGAGSSLQRVVESQRALVGVLADVAQDRGGSSIATKSVVDRLDASLGSASHITEQMLACERAIADLWGIILEGARR